jgi:hypothetical protein
MNTLNKLSCSTMSDNVSQCRQTEPLALHVGVRPASVPSGDAGPDLLCKETLADLLCKETLADLGLLVL